MDPNTPTMCDAKRYSKLVNLHLRASIFRERKEFVFLFEDEENTLSDEKIISLQDVNSMRVLRRLEPYIVNKARGKQVITFQEALKGEIHVIVPPLPPLTGIYETLMKIHLENDHAPSKLIKAKTEESNPLNLSYKRLPNICYDLIQYFCKGCNKNYTGASARGSVFFMYQMSLVPETRFNTLMIYMDENTEFMFLRPINVADLEVATELFKLFMQIGTPEEINVNHTCKMTCYALQNKMQILCPTCEVTSDSGRENDKYITRMIMNEIGAWMKTADSKIWQLGCSVVQNQLNNTIRAQIPGSSDFPVTAYDLFYKNPAIFGPPEASRWFPDIQRQFVIDEGPPHTQTSNFKSRIKPKDQEKPVEISQELMTSVPMKTIPLSAEEARKINSISYRGRKRGRPKKYK